VPALQERRRGHTSAPGGAQRADSMPMQIFSAMFWRVTLERWNSRRVLGWHTRRIGGGVAAGEPSATSTGRRNVLRTIGRASCLAARLDNPFEALEAQIQQLRRKSLAWKGSWPRARTTLCRAAESEACSRLCRNVKRSRPSIGSLAARVECLERDRGAMPAHRGSSQRRQLRHRPWLRPNRSPRQTLCLDSSLPVSEESRKRHAPERASQRIRRRSMTSCPSCQPPDDA